MLFLLGEKSEIVQDKPELLFFFQRLSKKIDLHYNNQQFT